MPIIGADNIVRGAFLDTHPYSQQTLAAFLFDKLKAHGSSVLLVDAMTGKQTSAKDILQDAVTISVALRAYGVKPGDSVGFTSENRHEIAACILAILAVVDVETGKALPSSKEGELCLKGPYVMKGYHNNIKATEETIDKEGWLHTGDIGYYDHEGFIFIVDRLKELIKYKGYQVAPAELEALLLTNPEVKDAAVIGISDDDAGEKPLAFVVRQPGGNITSGEIQKFVADQVSPQKRFSGGVRFVETIPKNPSGKILRRKLRELYKAKSTVAKF